MSRDDIHRLCSASSANEQRLMPMGGGKRLRRLPCPARHSVWVCVYAGGALARSLNVDGNVKGFGVVVGSWAPTGAHPSGFRRGGDDLHVVGRTVVSIQLDTSRRLSSDENQRARRRPRSGTQNVIHLVPRIHPMTNTPPLYASISSRRIASYDYRNPTSSFMLDLTPTS